MSDGYELFLLVIQLPLFAVGVAALGVAWWGRRRRPRGSAAFAAGVGLLLGSNGLAVGVWQLGLHEVALNAGLDLEVLGLGMTVLHEVAATLAAALITAAVFLPERGDPPPG